MMNLNLKLKIPVGYQDLLELLYAHKPEHWLTNEDGIDVENEELIELLQTGSITVEIDGDEYEIVIKCTKSTIDFDQYEPPS